MNHSPRPRIAILVLGMHRSGTSALTRLLHKQGAVLPKTLMPAQADNPEGFFESLPIVRFNTQLLTAAGSSWDDPRPLDSAWLNNSAKRAGYVEQAARLLDSEYPDGERIVVKDPRISRLLPIWLDAMRSRDIEPRVLICNRNPLCVAASLEKRNGLDLAASQLLWLTYMLDAEYHSRGVQGARVDFDSLIDDWRKALSEAYDGIALDSLDLGTTADTEDDRLVEPALCHHRADTDDVLGHRGLSHLTKAAWVAFSVKPQPGSAVFDGFRNRLEDAWNTISPDGYFPGHGKLVENDSQLPKPVGGSIADEAPRDGHRKVIVHYHLFKNAGTSLDHVLKSCFGTTWHEHEGSRVGWLSQDVAEYIDRHRDIVVLSSHTALLPPPVVKDTTIFPVIFIRHPIDRIRSIYEFERKQVADTEGARMAKDTDFAGYVAWRIRREGDRSIRNFQAYRFALAVSDQPDAANMSELDMALKAAETLPFVGVVERFDESLARLQGWLKPHFPHIDFKPTKANVTQAVGVSLAERVDALRTQLGEELYGELLKENEADLRLYDACVLRFEMNI